MNARRISRCVVLLGTLLFPGLVLAQTAAGIAGVVRDNTGSVLPGVSVEATSPALIEKVRTVVTDGEGRYNIVDLRPGNYTVTFSLAGFATLRREGIDLSAGFTATVNAELKVGGVTETITVSGASPVVDIQNVRAQRVMKLEVLEALPSGSRDLTQFASLTIGASPSNAGRHDVGGSLGETATGITIHGGRGDDGKVNFDGMNTNVTAGDGGGQGRAFKFNMLAVQETVVDTGGAGADTEGGGAHVNMIPREGGNTFSLHSVLTYTNEHLASSAVPDSLIARGSAPNQNSMKKVFDYGVGIGGAVVQDRLWFYGAGRYWSGQGYGANAYFNKSEVFYRYEPDLSRPAYADTTYKDVGGRLTSQVSSKHKVSSSLHWQQGCLCALAISFGAPFSPEAAADFRYDGMWFSQTNWTYPATNRLLFQAGASFLFQDVKQNNAVKPGPTSFAITEQTTGRTWGALPGTTQGGSYEQPHPNETFSQRLAASYVTGTHAVKVGMQTLQAVSDSVGDARPGGANFLFRNGVPLSITQWAVPIVFKSRVRSLGLYAQDQWTIRRLTLNLGVRFDHFTGISPAFTVPAGPFIGERSFPKVDNFPNFKDVTPRLGAAYDLFGNGKTAIKGYWGRYLMGQGGGDARNLGPAAAIQQNTTRLWNDTNANFLPDCELTNLQGNGECGTVLNLGFGQPIPVLQWAESARVGWGVRQYNYQTSVGIQHELASGVGVSVAYFRTDWRNQQAIVNTALTPADFTPYCITAPVDPRLGRVSGTQVCGLYDQTLAKLGQVSNVRMLAKDVPGRDGLPLEVFNGVDMLFNARFAGGALLNGGVTLGRTTFDYCWHNNLPQVSQAGSNSGAGATPAGLPRTSSSCRIQSDLWNGIGSQIKVQVVYPLPLSLTVSGTYKNVPGVPITALYVFPNAEARTSLGRDLSACRGAVPCTATASVQLLPLANNSGNSSATKYDDRVNQIDLRLTRAFRINTGRVQAVAELYNVLNERPAQGSLATYGAVWLRPTSLLGGRLFKFGAQVDW